jgi:hypothetical protein
MRKRISMEKKTRESLKKTIMAKKKKSKTKREMAKKTMGTKMMLKRKKLKKRINLKMNTDNQNLFKLSRTLNILILQVTLMK